MRPADVLAELLLYLTHFLSCTSHPTFSRAANTSLAQSQAQSQSFYNHSIQISKETQTADKKKHTRRTTAFRLQTNNNRKEERNTPTHTSPSTPKIAYTTHLPHTKATYLPTHDSLAYSHLESLPLIEFHSTKPGNQTNNASLPCLA